MADVPASVDGLVELYHVVSDGLGREHHESLQQTAFRVVRLNIAPPLVQECARIILGATGRPPREQWAALQRCHRLLTTPPPRRMQPNSEGD